MDGSTRQIDHKGIAEDLQILRIRLDSGTIVSMLLPVHKIYSVSTCEGQSLCTDWSCSDCFLKSFASHRRSSEWFDTEQYPRMVTKHSKNKYWFKCHKCNHSFEGSPYSICYKDSWCPYCLRNQLCTDPNCLDCYEKSFMSNEKMPFWNYELNKKSPRYVRDNERNSYWFTCGTCNHNFLQTPYDIRRGRWCHFCAGQALCKSIDCKFCYEKSFASVRESKYWHPTFNKGVEPRIVMKNTSKCYWFLCHVCNKAFTKKIFQIRLSKAWCPHCADQLLCTDKNCEDCFTDSVASMEESIYWSYELNKGVSPRQVRKNTTNNHWFKCEHGSIVLAPPSSIMYDSWCSKCTYIKAVREMKDYLEKTKLTFIRNFKFTGTTRSYDFLLIIGNIYLLVEIDDSTHFGLSNTVQYIDRCKTVYAVSNGYSILRIDYLSNVEKVMDLILRTKLLQGVSYYSNPSMYEYIHGQPSINLDDANAIMY